MKLFQLLGFAPTDRDRKLTKLISNSYRSIRIVGRGTVRICPNEVRASDDFKMARMAAALCVAQGTSAGTAETHSGSGRQPAGPVVEDHAPEHQSDTPS